VANFDWRSDFDPREQKEIQLAELYAREFHHGTTGHNDLMIIANMSKMLDTVASTVEDPVQLAEQAYNAYGAVTDFKNFQGNPMPQWSDLPPRIQDAWRGAVARVLKALFR
jgi:hypothetical protein